jgi:hypothetical protein
MENIIPAWIFNQVLLKCGNILCRIIEIELYMDPDPYNHRDPDQLTYNCWYFHRQNGGNYKSGTYKGVDVTFGNSTTHNGILIRSILNLSNNDIIEGPCKVVNFILEQTLCSSINELVSKSSNQPPSISDTSFPLHLINQITNTNNIIYSSPRVGLTLNKCDNGNDLKYSYIFKPLRFTCFPNKINKYKSLMILEYLKSNIIDTNYNNICPNLLNSLTQIFGSTKNNILKWINYYIEGKNIKSSHNNIKLGVNTINDLCKTYGYLTY